VRFLDLIFGALLRQTAVNN